MTVYNDITQRDRYFKMEFVEFLEFFARMAEHVCKEQPLHRHAPMA